MSAQIRDTQTWYSAANFSLNQSLVINWITQAYILVNLFHDEQHFRLNLHINSVTVEITFEIRTKVLTLSSCNSDDLSISLTWTYFPFFQLFWSYQHKSLSPKSLTDFPWDNRYAGFSLILDRLDFLLWFLIHYKTFMLSGH